MVALGVFRRLAQTQSLPLVLCSLLSPVFRLIGVDVNVPVWLKGPQEERERSEPFALAHHLATADHDTLRSRGPRWVRLALRTCARPECAMS